MKISIFAVILLFLSLTSAQPYCYTTTVTTTVSLLGPVPYTTVTITVPTPGPTQKASNSGSCANSTLQSSFGSLCDIAVGPMLTAIATGASIEALTASCVVALAIPSVETFGGLLLVCPALAWVVSQAVAIGITSSVCSDAFQAICRYI